MPSLKSLKLRINSVKSTRKITSAMKLVAAAKLRRATDQVEAARPYAERMERMLTELAASMTSLSGAPPLIAGTGKQDVQLLIVCTSDRGLCGAFNGSVIRLARRTIRQKLAEGRQVKLFCVGRRARDQLRREFGQMVVDSVEGVGKPRLTFDDAQRIADRVLHLYAEGGFDVAHLLYNRFKSVIAQIPTVHQLIPFAAPADKKAAATTEGGAKAVYEFEPGEEEILAQLLPRNVSVQIFRALLESQAGEHGARMTAMDSATRNAGDMINRLTLTYNRTRQAFITKELIEIISGAEAL